MQQIDTLHFLSNIIFWLVYIFHGSCLYIYKDIFQYISIIAPYFLPQFEKWEFQVDLITMLHCVSLFILNRLFIPVQNNCAVSFVRSSHLCRDMTDFVGTRLGKQLSDRLASLRHHLCPIEGPPETSRKSRHYSVENLRGACNWAAIIPRGASFSEVSFV